MTDQLDGPDPSDAAARLRAIVEALEAAGNQRLPPGVHATQGGWVCAMRDELDPQAVAAVADQLGDIVVDVELDMVSDDRHWSVVTGPRHEAADG